MPSDLLLIAAVVSAGVAIVPTTIEAYKRYRAPRTRAAMGRVNLQGAQDNLSHASATLLDPTALRDKERASLVNLDPSQPVLFIVPSLSRDSQDSAPVSETVAFEDLRALQIIAGLMPPSLARDLYSAARVPDQPKQNLVVVCSPRRNMFAKSLLEHPLVEPHLSVNFVRLIDDTAGQNPERWGISLGDRVFLSPLHDQEMALRRDPTREHRLTDFGLLAKFANPWNPAAKAIVMAGVRALGTWGAGQCLLDHGADIVARVGTGDFIAIVRTVRESQFKDHVDTEIEMLELLPPIAG